MTEISRERRATLRGWCDFCEEKGLPYPLDPKDVRALLNYADERDRAEGRMDRLEQEAELQAQEARTANHTIAEIYQLCTGATGEPGNWNGAEPVRRLIERAEQAEERNRWLEAALRDVRPEIDSLIGDTQRSHENPRTGIVEDEEVAHELSKLQALHERIETLLAATAPPDSEPVQMEEKQSPAGTTYYQATMPYPDSEPAEPEQGDPAELDPEVRSVMGKNRGYARLRGSEPAPTPDGGEGGQGIDTAYLRKQAKCVYLATEASIADDISHSLKCAADEIDQHRSRAFSDGGEGALDE